MCACYFADTNLRRLYGRRVRIWHTLLPPGSTTPSPLLPPACLSFSFPPETPPFLPTPHSANPHPHCWLTFIARGGQKQQWASVALLHFQWWAQSGHWQQAVCASRRLFATVELWSIVIKGSLVLIGIGLLYLKSLISSIDKNGIIFSHPHTNRESTEAPPCSCATLIHFSSAPAEELTGELLQYCCTVLQYWRTAGLVSWASGPWIPCGRNATQTQLLSCLFAWCNAALCFGGFLCKRVCFMLFFHAMDRCAMLRSKSPCYCNEEKLVC